MRGYRQPPSSANHAYRTSDHLTDGQGRSRFRLHRSSAFAGPCSIRVACIVVHGFKCVAVVGSNVHVRLPKSFCVGVRPSCAEGYSTKPVVLKMRTPSLALIIRHLAVLTANSTLPLIWGYHREEVVTLNSQAAANFWNSAAPNGLLYDMTSDGIQ